jgi:hypothetical protein
MESSDYTSLDLVQDTFYVLTVENIATVQNLNILPGKTNADRIRSRESRTQKHMKARIRKFHISRNHVFILPSFLPPHPPFFSF